MVVNVYQPVDDGIYFVHDEDLWISLYKGVEVHFKVRWGWLVTDLLRDGRGCSGIWINHQTVVMKLAFRAEPFCFGDRMVCVREIAEGTFCPHFGTWIRFIVYR